MYPYFHSLACVCVDQIKEFHYFIGGVVHLSITVHATVKSQIHEYRRVAFFTFLGTRLSSFLHSLIN